MSKPSITISVGDRFTRLVVTEVGVINPSWKRKKTHARVTCDCGVSKIVAYGDLRRGTTKSCGCLNRENQRKKNTTHGLSGHGIHCLWKGMRERCENPNSTGYARYGGRGIKICKRWKDFSLFLADMGDRPTPKHTIDRIDNDGPYSPDNCRWATRVEQMRNASINRMVHFNGESLCASEWAERTGIKRSVLYARLKAGWSAERALTTPTAYRPPRASVKLQPSAIPPLPPT